MNNSDLKSHLQRLERKLLAIYALGLIALGGLSLVSNYLMKDQAARQATSMIKRTVIRDFRETIYTLNDAELGYFKAVVYFNRHGERLFSLPAGLDPELVTHPNFWQRILYSPIQLSIYFDQAEKNKVGSVLFIFNRFSHAPWAFLIWIGFLLATLPVVRQSRLRLIENYKRDLTLREESARADLARRVRHDIRSPLSALRIGNYKLKNRSDSATDIIAKATDRINEIVEELDLIRVPKEGLIQTTRERRVQPILDIVQNIVQETRIRLAYSRKIAVLLNLSTAAPLLYVDAIASELKRTLANVIENSVEACGEPGQVVVKLEKQGNDIVIEIKDNGKGIPAGLLSKVMQKGFTHGKKPDGSGLGLFYAESAIRGIGGRIEISSQENVETIVRIFLPAAVPPAWYRSSLDVPIGGTVLILEDQESSELAVRVRLDELRLTGVEFAVISFKSPLELLKWHERRSQADIARTLYLFDYDLGEGNMTGVDVAKKLSVHASTVLLTANFDSVEVQQHCVEHGIGLVPKPNIQSIALRAI